MIEIEEASRSLRRDSVSFPSASRVARMSVCWAPREKGEWNGNADLGSAKPCDTLDGFILFTDSI